jgi:hypothetical protein
MEGFHIGGTSLVEQHDDSEAMIYTVMLDNMMIREGSPLAAFRLTLN